MILPCIHPVRGGVGTSPKRWDVTVPIPAAKGRSLVGTVQICTAPATHTGGTCLVPPNYFDFHPVLCQTHYVPGESHHDQSYIQSMRQGTHGHTVLWLGIDKGKGGLLQGAWPANSASSPSANSSISTKKDCANRKPASMTSRPTCMAKAAFQGIVKDWEGRMGHAGGAPR